MARRLARPLDPSAVAGRPVTVRWDGREIQAREAEPLAVTLLASGRSTISRSFRFHRPRGLMCSTGQCGWCECEVDGVPSVRSCRVPVRDGLEAAGIPITSAELTMVPKTTVELDESGARQLLRLIDSLEDLDDVQEVHANFDIPEAVLEAVAG